MTTENESNGAGANPSGQRWVIYFSPDRRILWEDIGRGEQSPLDALIASAREHHGAACPADLEDWNAVLEATFLTRIPQAGKLSVQDGETERHYSVKAFPDFDLDGDFKGVIEVIDPLAHAGDEIDHKKAVDHVLDLTLCGVILYDPRSDRILNLNRRVAQQTGYAVSELTSMSGSELFGNAGAQILRNIFDRIENAGHNMVWGQTLTVADRSGEKKSYFCSLRSIPELPIPDSRMVMCISMEAAEASIGFERGNPVPNHNFVLEAMQDGLWEYNVEDKVFYYSRNFGDIFGFDGVDRGVGKPLDSWMEAVHPEEADAVFKSWRLLLKKGSRYRTQYRIRDKDGNWRWIVSTIHAILNDTSGRPARVLGFHMDITAAMRTQMNLVDAEERLRMIFDNAGIGVAIANMDGTLKQVNPALALMLGKDQEDLEGQQLADYAYSEELDDMWGSLRRLNKGGRQEIMTGKRFQGKNGRMLWVNITATVSKSPLSGDRFLIVMVEDVTERQIVQNKLQFEATHDSLTGVWNRGVLMERLGQHINLALRHRQPMTFCICDLDHFKWVNDMHGHQAGDRVLVEFVKKLAECVRNTDILGRYGGEEFGIVFPATTVEGAVSSMERAREFLKAVEFKDAQGSPFRVTATFGISEVKENSSIRSVVAEADAALYQGKNSGRDRVVVYNADGGSAEWLMKQDEAQ